MVINGAYTSVDVLRDKYTICSLHYFLRPFLYINGISFVSILATYLFLSLFLSPPSVFFYLYKYTYIFLFSLFVSVCTSLRSYFFFPRFVFFAYITRSIEKSLKLGGCTECKKTIFKRPYFATIFRRQ